MTETETALTELIFIRKLRTLPHTHPSFNEKIPGEANPLEGNDIYESILKCFKHYNYNNTSILKVSLVLYEKLKNIYDILYYYE